MLGRRRGQPDRPAPRAERRTGPRDRVSHRHGAQGAGDSTASSASRRHRGRAAARRERGSTSSHDLVVVDFYGEEPNDFGLSCVGSRAVAGNLDARPPPTRPPRRRHPRRGAGAWRRTSRARTAASWRLASGTCSIRRAAHRAGAGPRGSGCPIGIVSGIAGIHAVRASPSRPPRPRRHDADGAAARRRLCRRRIGTRGRTPRPDGGISVGRAADSCPGAAERRPRDRAAYGGVPESRPPWIDGPPARSMRRRPAERRATGRRVVSRVDLGRAPGAGDKASVADAIAAAARAAGHPTVELPSGAGHDTVQMARLTTSG